jgi:hypothetical protein
LDPVPVDVDVHAIPANPRKGEPVHDHYDLAYLFRAAPDAVVTLDLSEVSGFRWGRRSGDARKE